MHWTKAVERAPLPVPIKSIEKAKNTRFDDSTSRFDVEVHNDHTRVHGEDDLSSSLQRRRPEEWIGSQHVKPSVGRRTDLVQ